MDVGYSYLRFSSPEQSKGDSVRRQDALRDGWLARTKIPLDESLTFADKGVSGFSTPANDREGLQAFVSCVKSGRVRPGSYLIIENLDRLSREDIWDALALLLDLVRANIRIVQLSPEMVFDRQSEPMKLMMAIMELSRGHSESAIKSVRLSEVWGKKKKNAATKKVGNKTPVWLLFTQEDGKQKARIIDGTFTINEERAAIIRRIFALAHEGHGNHTIVKMLNKEGVKNWKGKNFSPSTIYHVLTSRTVLGEYQPHKGRSKGKKKRQAEGEPIKGYYPALVDEDTFYSVQAALTQRQTDGGGRKSAHVNLFGGLMVDARDGGPIHAHRMKNKASLYMTANGRRGVAGSVFSSFPLEELDYHILRYLAEVQVSEESGPNRLGAIAGELADVEEKLKELESHLTANPKLANRILASMSPLEDRKQELLAEQEQEQRKASAKPVEDWAHLKGLLSKPLTDTEYRQKLYGAIRRTVAEIRCLFVGSGTSPKVAIVRIKFKPETLGVRHYRIDYWPKNWKREKRCMSSSFNVGDFSNPGDFADIATPEGVKAMERNARCPLRELP